MKTNKNYWILAATVLTTSLFTACNEKKQAETAEVNVPAEELTASTADEIFTTEPLTINKKGPKGTNISYQLRIDFPSQGPEQLLSSARKAIKRVMLGAEADDRTTKEGLDAIAQRFIETSSREIQELQSAATEESSLAYTYEGTILMTENTATYITYHLNDYLYSGGIGTTSSAVNAERIWKPRSRKPSSRSTIREKNPNGEKSSNSHFPSRHRRLLTAGSSSTMPPMKLTAMPPESLIAHCRIAMYGT